MSLGEKNLWGNWEFSEESVRVIKELNTLNPTVDTISNVYTKLIQECHTTHVKEANSPSYLNDYSPQALDDSSSESNDEEIVQFVPNIQDDEGSLQSEVLLESIKDYYNNIRTVSKILALKNEERLNRIVEDTWRQLTDVELKKKFILAIMANDKGALFMRRIILKSFQTGDFNEALMDVAPVISLLENLIVEEVAIPLLLDKNSAFVSDIGHFKAFVSCLETGQRYNLTKSFLGQMKDIVSSWHFKMMEVLIGDKNHEARIIEELLYLLKSVVGVYSRDNSLGKLLMVLVEPVQSMGSVELNTLFAHVVENYEGTGKLLLRSRTKSLIN